MSAKTDRHGRREDIITAADDLFSRHGFHGTTVPDIARAAGISAGLIYYFFASKGDILLACFEKNALIYLDLFKETASDIVDPLERFDFVVRKLYKALDRGSKGVLLTYRDVSTLPRAVRHRILDILKSQDDQFLALFEEGQRAGIFRPDIPNPRVLAANVLGLGHLWALQKTWRFLPEIDLETYTSTQLDYFHRQLLPETSVTEPSTSPDPSGVIVPPDKLATL